MLDIYFQSWIYFFAGHAFNPEKVSSQMFDQVDLKLFQDGEQINGLVSVWWPPSWKN